MGGAGVRDTCVAGAGFDLACVFEPGLAGVLRPRSVGARAAGFLARGVPATGICGMPATARGIALARRGVCTRVVFHFVLSELVEARRRTSRCGAPQQEPQAARACKQRVEGGPFHAVQKFVHAFPPAVKPGAELA